MVDNNSADTTAPVDTGPLDFDDGVNAVEAVLDGLDDVPATQYSEKVSDKTESNRSDPELESEGVDESDAESEEEADAEDNQTEEDDDAEYDGEDEEDSEDGDQEEEDLVSDDAIVELENGNRISVGQLKNQQKEFQADITQKYQKVAAERKEVETQGERVIQTAKDVAQHQQFLMEYARSVIPEQPDPRLLDDDPLAYVEAKAKHEEAVAGFQNFQNRFQQYKQQIAQQEAAAFEQAKPEILKREMEVLRNYDPDFSDPKKAPEIQQKVSRTMLEYFGFTPQEIEPLTYNGKAVAVMAAAAKWVNFMAQKPAEQARKAVEGKPKMLKSGKRVTTSNRRSRKRKASADRLRKTGSIEAAIDSLLDMDIDL